MTSACSSDVLIYPPPLCRLDGICLVKKFFCKPQPWPDFGGRVTALSSVDDFETFVQREATRTQLIVIDCYAEWCGPCRRAAPVFAEWSEEMSGCAFAKVNTDSAADLSARLGVRVLPTFKIYRSSQLCDVKWAEEGGLQASGAEAACLNKRRSPSRLAAPAPGRPLCRWAHGVSCVSQAGMSVSCATSWSGKARWGNWLAGAQPARECSARRRSVWASPPWRHGAAAYGGCRRLGAATSLGAGLRFRRSCSAFVARSLAPAARLLRAVADR